MFNAGRFVQSLARPLARPIGSMTSTARIVGKKVTFNDPTHEPFDIPVSEVEKVAKKEDWRPDGAYEAWQALQRGEEVSVRVALGEKGNLKDLSCDPLR